jgi:glycosyltransferase involved in cell wall biosynthesis
MSSAAQESRLSSAEGGFSAAVRRGDAARDARRWGEAAQAYRSALDAKPDAAGIWVQYGHMLKEAGNPDEARVAYERALELEPDKADTYLQIGHLHKIQAKKLSAIQMYSRALQLDPTMRDARQELTALGAKARADSILLEAKAAIGDDAKFYYDLSDIMVHFLDNRTPTGIQRIVLAVAEAAVAEGDAKDIGLCTLDPKTGLWKRVDTEAFLHLMMLSHEGAQHSDPEWQSAYHDIARAVVSAPPLVFAQGSVVVSLGSPWGLQNYFRAVHEAKRDHGISYVAFVHDTVPLIYPEYCEGVIPLEYVRWLHNLLSHADLVLANAEQTKRDFLDAISRFNAQSVRCEVVYPNGDFTSLFQSAEQVSPNVRSVLSSKYALFVGTIQPRKNHLMVMSAWRELIREFGPSGVPTLVFAGKLGWYWEQVVEFIRKTDNLDGKLKMLNQVSDADLQELYKNCMFTIYNSHYEGWGLPVTESLSFGKVPVIPRNSSLIESGGKDAIFFDSNSEPSLLSVIREIIRNPEVLTAREKAIAADRPVRSWRAIAEQIRATVDAAVSAKREQAETASALAIRLGTIYRFGLEKIYQAGKKKGSYNPTVFEEFEIGELVRTGSGWYSPEEWGLWTAAQYFKLEFTLDRSVKVAPGKNVWLYLRIQGQHENAALRLGINDMPPMETTVPAHATALIRVAVPAEIVGSGKLILRAHQGTMTDLMKITEGKDPRTVGIGLRSFMFCHEDDIDARLRFIEEMSNYITVAPEAGDTQKAADLGEFWAALETKQEEGGFLRLGGQRADIAHAGR